MLQESAAQEFTRVGLGSLGSNVDVTQEHLHVLGLLLDLLELINPGLVLGQSFHDLLEVVQLGRPDHLGSSSGLTQCVLSLVLGRLKIHHDCFGGLHQENEGWAQHLLGEPRQVLDGRFESQLIHEVVA